MSERDAELRERKLAELDALAERNAEVYVKDRYTSGTYRIRKSDGKYYLSGRGGGGKFEWSDVAWVEGDQVNLRTS